MAQKKTTKKVKKSKTSNLPEIKLVLELTKNFKKLEDIKGSEFALGVLEMLKFRCLTNIDRRLLMADLSGLNKGLDQLFKK